MAISYNRLWKLLVDKKMSKADLRKAAGLAPNTMTKLRRDEPVAMGVLEKICGIKDGPILPYWLEIKKLVTPETTLVTKLPWQTGLEANPMKPYATQFLR